MIRVFAAAGGPGPLELSPEESHYLVRVRRAVPGTDLEVLDGRGGVWAAKVLRPDPRRAAVEIVGAVDRPAPPAALDLVVGVPKAPAVLDVIEAATVLGAATVRFAATAWSQTGFPSAGRVDRVLRSALRQCGRPAPPTIAQPVPLAAALAAAEGRRYLAAAGAGPPAPWTGDRATLAIGPEAGFSPEEVASLRAAGFVPVGLGPWTLRTEVAAAAGLAALWAARRHETT